MKLFPLFATALSVAFATCSCSLLKPAVSPNTPTPRSFTIGVILPLEHPSIEEIVKAFKSRLTEQQDYVIEVRVRNAQGDANLQRVIIQQMCQENCSILAPIGLGATQMSLQLAGETPIVAIAADLTQLPERANLTGIMDECKSLEFLQFVEALLPNLKKISLIYSPSDKIFPEVGELKALCNEKRIALQSLMIHSLSDLQPTVQAVDKDSEALLVLKDHLIVSAMASLTQLANARHLPLLASDEGSVISGAAAAYGCRERDSGREGAEIALEILSGQSVSSIKPRCVKARHLFFNREGCQRQGISQAQLETAAATLKIDLIELAAPSALSTKQPIAVELPQTQEESLRSELSSKDLPGEAALSIELPSEVLPSPSTLKSL